MPTWLNRIALIVVFATIPSFASAQTARESDSLLNGALIGAGAGIASELVLCRMMEPWDVCVAPGPMVTFGAVGAGIGIVIDALIRSRRADDSVATPARLYVAPVVARDLRGLRMSFRF